MLFSWNKKRVGSAKKTSLPGRALSGRRHTLRLEPLEDRRMLTTFLVDSLDDVVAEDGVITLREAIEAANTNAAIGDAVAGSDTETDQITFKADLFAGGPATIGLTNTPAEVAQDAGDLPPLLSLWCADSIRFAESIKYPG